MEKQNKIYATVQGANLLGCSTKPYRYCDDAEHYFPELRESEDERVRNGLIGEIEFIIPHEDETDSEGLILPSYRARIDKYRTYLEKQKDQKPAEQDYDNRIQYDSVKSGIEAFASTYSFNIESKLFPQLTKEQQQIWREEIEQAAIAGGESGVELSRDNRYKENRMIEWSEEDEKCIKDIIVCLEYLKKEDTERRWNGDHNVHPERYSVMINKLKSLRPRPHWKPSEEQIGILGKVFAGCQLKDSERDSMVDLFYHLKDMI